MDEIESDGTRVLVSAASKHGATAEIAEHIGTVLGERGLTVDVAAPDDVRDVDRYTAFVLGSAVYAGHWMENALSLAMRIAGKSPLPSVWLFSSGPIGDPPKPDEDPVDVSEIVDVTKARNHRLLSGKIDKSKLSFAEKAILIAVRSPEGDFRNWDEIDEWAGEIADVLAPARIGTRKANGANEKGTNDSGRPIGRDRKIEA